LLRAPRIVVNIVGEVPGHLLAARVNNGIRRAAFERRTRGTMKKEHGEKLDPNDPAIPAKPDKPTALSDEDLDEVAGGSTGGGLGTVVIDPGTIDGNSLGDALKKRSYKGIVTLVR
jgi:hypothetical protein